MYQIKTIRSAEELSSGNVADISVYNWGGEYRPESKATLCFIPNEGFLLKIWSMEENPALPSPERMKAFAVTAALNFSLISNRNLPIAVISILNATQTVRCCVAMGKTGMTAKLF